MRDWPCAVTHTTRPPRGRRRLRQPGVRFPLLEFAKVKAAAIDKDLKIPEAVIKARVTQLLERMERRSG